MNTYQNICAYTYKLAERDRVFFMRFYWPCLWTCIMGEIFRLLGTSLFIRIYIYIHAPHSLTQSTRTHNHTHLCMHKYVFACSYVRVRGAYMCPSLACCHKLRASSDRSIPLWFDETWHIMSLLYTVYDACMQNRQRNVHIVYTRTFWLQIGRAAVIQPNRIISFYSATSKK